MPTATVDNSDLLKSPAHPLQSPRPYGTAGGGGNTDAAANGGGFGGDGGFGSSGGFGDGGGFGGAASGFTPGHSSENGAQSVRDDRGFNKGIFKNLFNID